MVYCAFEFRIYEFINTMSIRIHSQIVHPSSPWHTQNKNLETTNAQWVGEPSLAYTGQNTGNTKTQRIYCPQKRGLSRVKQSPYVLVKNNEIFEYTETSMLQKIWKLNCRFKVSQLYRASLYYQSLLFTNWGTMELL